jgi:DNA-binding transcriptional LysR family regulator
MDSRDLRVFEAVARHSAVHGAARELNTVQSNVTMRIRQIEDELGISLFERHAKGMRLTHAGQRLLPHAVEVQAALEKARRAVTEDGVPKGPLVIGTLQSIFTIHLTGMLAPYLAAFPEVDVSLHTATTTDLIGQVLSGKLEGAFVYGPLENPGLAAQVVFEGELVILSPLSVTKLDALPATDTRMIVLRSGWNRKRLELILSKHGLQHLRVLELGTLDAVLDCVSAGLGVTLLPRDLLNNVRHRDFVQIHKISGPTGRVQAVFVRRADSFVSSALSTFLDHVRDSLKQRETAEAIIMSHRSAKVSLDPVREVSCGHVQASKKEKKTSVRQTP